MSVPSEASHPPAGLRASHRSSKRGRAGAAAHLTRLLLAALGGGGKSTRRCRWVFSKRPPNPPTHLDDEGDPGPLASAVDAGTEAAKGPLRCTLLLPALTQVVLPASPALSPTTRLSTPLTLIGAFGPAVAALLALKARAAELVGG